MDAAGVIAIWRVAMDWTQEQLASKAGLSSKAIGQVEAGLGVLPDGQLASGLEAAFGWEPGTLQRVQNGEPNAAEAATRVLAALVSRIPDPVLPPELTVHPPIYLISSRTSCYRCDRPGIPVVAVAVSRLSDIENDDTSAPALLSYVTELPDPILRAAADVQPLYRLHHSRSTDFEYLTNFCECGANLGDHYLHSPGDAFCPLTSDQADGISLTLIDAAEPLPVRGNHRTCSPEMERLLDAFERRT